MGIYEGRATLGKGIKELLQKWVEAKNNWDDAMSEAIEKDHLVPLEMDVKSAVSAMEHMAQVLAQLKSDCQ